MKCDGCDHEFPEGYVHPLRFQPDGSESNLGNVIGEYCAQCALDTMRSVGCVDELMPPQLLENARLCREYLAQRLPS